MNNSELLQQLIREYKEHYLLKEKIYEPSLLGDVQRIKDALLNEKFKPSVQLRNILNKQIKRAVNPMSVAIVGQFSSGKSTFLNALISKDILPTGITPVTSKVIYIKYGEEHKLKVTYKSGATVYHPIENISMFSDQRVTNMDNIKYLTVYAPVEILKEISFVDTPGLNSQSQEDTSSTKKVLQDVGGIIWLTLIDNAGKRSEQEILDEYLPSFKTKSLCVLNQKDKFNDEQIADTTFYIEEKFSNYFSKVIPISAKVALDSRTIEPGVLIDNALNELIKNLKKGVENNPQCRTLKFFSNDYDTFKKRLDEIHAMDRSRIEEDIHNSNINEVLDFINQVMRPNAMASKAFRIKNDLKNFCDILINSYRTMAGVHDALNKTLEDSKEKCSTELESIHVHYAKDLKSIYTNIDDIFKEIALLIYDNIVPHTAVDYKESRSSFLNQKKIEPYTYDSFRIDQDQIMNRLFYLDQNVEKRIKRVIRQLKNFESNTNNAFEGIYLELQSDVVSWQNKYLLLSKNREISSDLEFSSVKRFASKVHENILKSFHIAILGSVEALNKESAYLNGALDYNFMQTVQVTLYQMAEKILESEEIHKKDPSKFAIYKPSEEDILHRLKLNFDFDKIDDSLISKNSFLAKVVKRTKKEFLEIADEKITFVSHEKLPYMEKIEDLQVIKRSIVHDESSEEKE